MLSVKLPRSSLRSRLYAIAAATAICTTISVAANFLAIRDYEANMEHIAQGELIRLNQIAHSFRELSDIHTELFNLLRAAGTRRSEQDVYLLGSKLLDRIDKLHRFLVSGNNQPVLDKQGRPYQSPFIKLGKNLQIYREAASISIEMLSVNPSLSEKYMLKATASFNKLNQQMSINTTDISKHIHKELREDIELIHSIYWPVSLLVILIASLMVPLIIKFLRELSTKFSWIETTLDNLRTGKTDVDIPQCDTDREMHTICESLSRFREALIKLRDSENALSEKNRLLIQESERRILTEKELRRSLIELSKAMDVAEASNKAKSLFLANMSHELRTPLNAVLGMAQLLQATKLDETQTEYIDTLYKQGRHLLQLMDSLLDYARLESDKLVLQYQAFELDNLLDEISSLFRPDQSKSDVKLSLQIDPDVDKQMFGDPLRIRQILINLLSNAYKFTKQGNIHVHIQNNPVKPACAEIRPQNCPNKENREHCPWRSLYITVQDTGIGIARDKQQYIFNNFTQADESTTRQFGGAGIGLAICKQLVQLMDGEIGVESEPGQGATFWFRICLPNPESLEQSKLA